MGLHGVAMQKDFAATAQSQAGGRADHREGGVFDRLVGVLAGRHQLFDFRPGGDIGGEQHQSEIGAGREIAAFVVDHHGLELFCHGLQAFAQQGDGVGIQRIHLAGELETGDAVADVPQGRRAVLQDRLAAAFDVGQQDNALGTSQFMVAVVGAEIVQAAVLDAVEAAVPHLAQQRRHDDALGRQAFRQPGGAQFVDQLEGAEFPGVTKAHGLVDGGDVIGRLRHQRGGIGQRAAQHPPGIAPGPVVTGQQGLEVPRQIEVGLDLGAVLAGGQGDGLLDLAAAGPVQAIKPALAFAPGIAFGDHPVGQRLLAAIGLQGIVGRQQADHAAHHMGHQIEAHQVDQAEHPGLGKPHGLADHRVDFLDLQALFEGFDHRAGDPEHTQAIADEARPVLAGNHRFAEPEVGEAADGGDGLGTGVRAPDHFQQAHIAGRIEEMGDAEIAGEPLGQTFGQPGQRNGRGVGRHHRARLAHRLQTGIKLQLDVQLLDHRFDDPVAIGQQGEVGPGIAGRHQLCRGLAHERRRIGLQHFLHRLGGTARHHVQQHHRHPGIGDMGGDPRPHHPGADNADLFDFRRHHTASRMVAMPWPPPMHWVARA